MNDITTLIQRLINGTSGMIALSTPDLTALVHQAQALSQPILDYEAAARAAGWDFDVDGEEFRLNDTGDGIDAFWKGEPDAWQELCSLYDLAPIERPVTRFSIVTPREADDLEAEGGTLHLGTRYPGRLDQDFAGLCIWASTEGNIS